MLERALKAAIGSDHPDWRVGAVIAKGKRILASAANQPRTDPRLASFEHLPRCSRHAEMAALARCANPRGAHIYVARVTLNDTPAMARPCQRCLTALDAAGVRKVTYTTYAGVADERIAC